MLPAYHSNWDEAERSLLADPAQRLRIEELVAELTRRGFERPVVVDREHWWSVRPQVSDGVHRSIAAMRAGLAIPVRFGFDEAAVYDHSDLYRVTATVLPLGPEDLQEAVMDLTSFRCSAGPWIQCDSASGAVNGPVDIYLAHHPDLRPLIAAELQERLRSGGVADAVVEFLEHRPYE